MEIEHVVQRAREAAVAFRELSQERVDAIVWAMAVAGHDDEERRDRLFSRVDELLASLRMPGSLREAGVTEERLEAALPELARAAFTDPSLRTNPRMPLLSEITALLRAGF